MNSFLVGIVPLLLFVTGCKEPTYDEAEKDYKNFVDKNIEPVVRPYETVFRDAQSKMRKISTTVKDFGVNHNTSHTDPTYTKRLKDRQQEEMQKAKIDLAEVRRLVDKMKSEKLLENSLAILEQNKKGIDSRRAQVQAAAEREKVKFTPNKNPQDRIRNDFDELEKELVRAEAEIAVILGR